MTIRDVLTGPRLVVPAKRTLGKLGCIIHASTFDKTVEIFPFKFITREESCRVQRRT